MLLALAIYCVVGLIAGYLGARLMDQESSNWTRNLIIGLIGSLLGGVIGMVIGLQSTNLLGSIILAVAGSCLAIWLNNKYFKK